MLKEEVRHLLLSLSNQVSVEGKPVGVVGGNELDEKRTNRLIRVILRGLLFRSGSVPRTDFLDDVPRQRGDDAVIEPLPVTDLAALIGELTVHFLSAEVS